MIQVDVFGIRHATGCITIRVRHLGGGKSSLDICRPHDMTGPVVRQKKK